MEVLPLLSLVLLAIACSGTEIGVVHFISQLHCYPCVCYYSVSLIHVLVKSNTFLLRGGGDSNIKVTGVAYRKL